MVSQKLISPPTWQEEGEGKGEGRGGGGKARTSVVEERVGVSLLLHKEKPLVF